MAGTTKKELQAIARKQMELGPRPRESKEMRLRSLGERVILAQEMRDQEIRRLELQIERVRSDYESCAGRCLVMMVDLERAGLRNVLINYLNRTISEPEAKRLKRLAAEALGPEVIASARAGRGPRRKTPNR